MGEVLHPLLHLPGDLAEAGREVAHKLHQVLHRLNDLRHRQIVQHLNV